MRAERLTIERTICMKLKHKLIPPVNEVCEGYVFTPVCQSFCSRGGGVCLSVCWDTPPGKQTPPGKFVKVMFLLLSVSHSVHWGVSASVHAGIHPPGKQTPRGSRHPLRSACWEIRPTSNRTILQECILVHINFGSLFGRCRMLAFNTPADNIKHVK